MRFAAIPALATLLAVSTASVSSCSNNSGDSGSLSGVLNVPGCWVGSYNLYPNFFAATPYLATLELRIQRGGDYETFSDGAEILIDNTSTIIPNEYGKPLSVSLPAGVTPVGVPLAANPNPSIVHFSLYLQATCQIQDVALYALDAVTLGPSGSCDLDDDGGPPACPGSTSGLADVDGGPPDGSTESDASLDAGADAAPAADAGAVAVGDGGAASEAGAAAGSIGRSVITFTSLFDGNENAVSAQERFNAGHFDVYLADPRESCPGGIGPPPPCRGHLTGDFSFYFERGRPAQPFP